MPAPCTRKRTGPPARPASTIASLPARWATSAGQIHACDPASWAVASKDSLRRPTSRTRSPSRASATAITRPRPEPAPVTMASSLRIRSDGGSAVIERSGASSSTRTTAAPSGHDIQNPANGSSRHRQKTGGVRRIRREADTSRPCGAARWIGLSTYASCAHAGAKPTGSARWLLQRSQADPRSNRGNQRPTG